MFSPVTTRVTSEAIVPADEPACDLDRIRARVLWQPEHGDAAHEPAKTNVTVLRRRASEEDDEARPLFKRRRAARRDGGLSAAQIGTAHHTFLQHMEFTAAESELSLRNEAQRLSTRGVLREAEASSLDFGALRQFWQSPLGRRIAATPAPCVHRELPFTARFTTAELRAMELGEGEFAEGEFVVVQGVADLAVILPEGITIVDFKTDVFPRAELDDRAREYTPQLQLYAAALGRIYHRPVTGLALHFLALGETRPIFVR